jgi:multidrug efflux pump subunit AcrB
MENTPGIADVQIGRDEGRPEIAVRVDRPKAAMLGMTVSGVATTIQTNVQGTTAAQFRERGNEYPIVVRSVERSPGDCRRRRRAAEHADGQVVPARTSWP